MAEDPPLSLTRARAWGTVSSLVWAALVIAYGAGFLATTAPTGAALVFRLLGLLAALLVPLGAIWGGLAVFAAALEAAARPAPAPKVDLGPFEAELAAQARRIQALEAQLRHAQSTPRPAPDPAPKPPPPVQPDLPLDGGGDGSGEVTLAETVRALNFPQDPDDKAGFQVLSRAMATPDLARLLRSAEDCLTLLAHEGLYMDDLMPAPATAADWRQFAQGGTARAELLPLTGITDQGALETVRAAMRRDPIFRDTALFFQRKFDQMLNLVAPEASDKLLLDLVDTRSGRAFVLLVQVHTNPETV